MLEISRLVGAVSLSLATLASAGVGGGGEYPLPNADFDLGLRSWSQWASDATTPFQALPSPDGPGQAARCDLPPGVEARMHLAVPIGAAPGWKPEPGAPGEKVDFGAWLWLEPSATAGEVWLTLESHDGSVATTLAESERVDPDAAPKGRWLFLQVRPDPVADARVRSDSRELRYVLHSSATGAVWFDAARAGRFQYSEYPLENGSFEQGLPAGGAWQVDGYVTVNDQSSEPEGYYGIGHARLEGWGGTAVSQEIAMPDSPAAPFYEESPAPRAGSSVEAGVWARISPDAYLSGSPDPDVYVEIAVWGAEGRGPDTLLARGRWHPTLDERDYWRFVQTEPLAQITHRHESIRVEVLKSFSADLWIDFVQVGEAFSLDGNPRRRVGCNYVGRYRSPLYPGCTTSPTAPRDIWRNWHWTTPNACDNSYTGFFHNPDCNTSPDCFRANGRRDLAVSTLDSLHDLPLVGSYDSRDRDVIRYHLDLAEAAGIDHFIYDYLGHKLSLQNVLDGREPLNEETWLALIEVAEEVGRDFKLAVMYEPKVHYLGWVQGETSEQQKLDGMVADLTWLVETMEERRCALRHDGRLVVFVFRNTMCSPDGSQCLDDADWLAVASAVVAATGEELFLIGDLAPGSGSPFLGLSRWQLVHPDLLEFRTYDTAEAGVPSWPPPELSRLQDHTRAIHRLSRGWAAGDDTQRVSVGMVWPGFDDTGVGGWGEGNLTGEDGGPLCVRVAHDFSGQFYSTTVESALAEGCDWVHIATWNDWNEATRIEPAWHPDYFTIPFAVSLHSGKVFHQVFDRLAETATWIEAFKGEPSGVSLARVATEYLLRAALWPEVVAYD